MKPTLEQVYTYHPPFGDQENRYATIRRAALDLARDITDMTPASREQSVALTKVQEAVMWANAAIAVNEEAPPQPVGNPAYAAFETSGFVEPMIPITTE